jgi:hypothetical protein
VKDAAAVFPLPFGDAVKPSGSFNIEDQPILPNEPGPHADKRWATPGLLGAMQIPLLRGRWFASSDTATTQRVAVIDEVLARAYWPHQDPIGKRIRFGQGDQWAQIVGIAAHTRRDSLEVDENKGVVYTAFAQQPVQGVTFIARSASDAESLRTPMVNSVHAADGAEALYDVTPLSTLVDASLAPRHLLVWMLSLFVASRSSSPPSASMACSASSPPSARSRSACAWRSVPIASTSPISSPGASCRCSLPASQWV